MIVATKTVDALLKGIVSPDKLMISRIDSITKSIQLDPNISEPKKEMFIVSNDDVKNARVRKEFIDSVVSKHPEVIMMYINKTGRDLPGIDSSMFELYLVKPKREDVRDAFLDLVAEAENKSKFEAKDEIDVPEDFSVKEEDFGVSSESNNDEELVSVKETNVPEKLDLNNDVEKEDVEEDVEINLLNRIKNSENFAALTTIANEVSASKIVREVTEANATFKQSENYVSALSENITAILSNPEYDTTTKLSKVRAILHDKAYIKAKTNSIIEQSVESIITAIVDKAREEVESKTQELNEKIIRALNNHMTAEAPNVRLATIIENRAKLLMELHALDLEIKGMATVCTDTINDTVDNIISDSVTSTNSPILDSQIQARYGNIVPENLLSVIDNLFQNGKFTSDEFGKMSEAVQSTIRKLYSLLSCYQEESEVLAETIKFLKANKVEDTVVANSIMKRTCRLFISGGSIDSSAIEYMVSKHLSRKDSNVLLVDLTSSDIFSLFNVKSEKLSTIMDSNAEIAKKFCVVSTYNDVGIDLTSIENCQRLSTKLIQYAKHYSIINIMCTPDQAEVIDFFKNDVISISYYVDCYPKCITKMAKCIKNSTVQNTATRVVLVNYIANSVKICSDLGIMDKLDIQLSMCKPVYEIRDCAICGQDPYDVESIVHDCEGVLGVC